MSTRCKMSVNSVAQNMDANGDVQSVTVTAQPIYSSDQGSENYSFWRSTPMGKFEIMVTNPAAYRMFKVGMAIYIDITEAPKT